MKMTKITVALAAALLMAGCQSQGNYVEPSSSPVCDQNGKVYQSENAAIRAGLSDAQYGATYCNQRNSEPASKVCDQFGNVYASERMAERAGLSDAQYGATYCK